MSRNAIVYKFNLILLSLYCFQGEYAFKSIDEVVNKEVEFKVEVSDDCEDFLRKLLMKETDKRLTFEKCFDHPWIKSKIV